LHLAQGTGFEKALSIHMLLRQGKERAAVTIGLPNMPQWRSYEMLLACAAKRPIADIDRLADAVKPSPDPETNYFAAAHLAYCGKTASAIDLLSKAVAGHYCAIPAMDEDPMLASIRRTPQFNALRERAAGCQRNFVRNARLN